MSTYSYSGSPQFVTVSVTGQYDIVAFGASGGFNGFSFGGLGAEVAGTFALTAGQKLEFIVGGMGQTQRSFLPGVGNGSSGGGGGTFVLSGFGNGYSPILIAGGGGARVGRRSPVAMAAAPKLVAIQGLATAARAGAATQIAPAIRVAEVVLGSKAPAIRVPTLAV